jgi:predicted transcriptional regulator
MKRHDDVQPIPSGYFATPNDVYNLGLSASEIGVLVYLCRCGNQRGGVGWPSHHDIATKIGVSKRQAQNAVARLRKKGVLTWTQQHKENGGLTSNRYTVNFEAIQMLAAKRTEEINAQPSQKTTPYSTTCHGGIAPPAIPYSTTCHERRTTEEELSEEELVEGPLHPQRTTHSISWGKYCENRKMDQPTFMTVEYFLDAYRRNRSETHPRLRAEVWERIVEDFFTFEYGPRSSTPGAVETIEREDMRPLIDLYFSTAYAEGCNYRLPHFASDGVKHMLMQRFVNGDEAGAM